MWMVSAAFSFIFSLCLTLSFYLSSLNSSYRYFTFLLLINPKSASWVGLAQPGKILLLLFLSYSLCCTVCSLFIFYFFMLLQVRRNLCLIILIPFSPDFFSFLWIIYSYFFHLFLFLFWVFVYKSFLNIQYVGPLKKSSQF